MLSTQCGRALVALTNRTVEKAVAALVLYQLLMALNDLAATDQVRRLHNRNRLIDRRKKNRAFPNRFTS
jgi:hypothetical protein